MNTRGIGIFVLCLVVAAAACREASAQDYLQVYRYPEIKTELKVWAGYGFVFDSGSDRGGYYRHLSSSPTGGVVLAAFPFPHRVYFELDYLNKNDYFMDARYAYKDILLTRWLNSTVYHNLNNYTLVDLGVPASSPDVDVRDAGLSYGLRTGVNRLFMRLKTPDYPFHVFLGGRFVTKDGERQSRFLGGSGYFNDLVRVSRKRNIDWRYSDINVGLNSHLGPVEAEYTHSERNLDVGCDRYFTENYTAGPARAAGTYPHSYMPDFEGSSDTIKVHSSFTGKVVAAATLTWADRSNNLSGATADVFTGAADLRLMPVTRLTVTFKYRHREKDVENPPSLIDGYYGLSTNPTAIAGIRPSISSKTDKFSGLVRYRPHKRITLYLGYAYKQTERTNASAWNVAPKTSENRVEVSAKARLPGKLKLTCGYEFTNTSSPAYNYMPEKSHRGRLVLSWAGLERVSAFMSYDYRRGSTDNVAIDTGAAQTLTGDRHTTMDRFIGNLTFIVTERLSVNAGYAYMRSTAEQDNIYGTTLVTDVKYRDRAQSVFASADFKPRDNIGLSAGINFTTSRGSFGPDPESIASFSAIDVDETIYSASARLGLPDKWDLALQYEFTSLDNRLYNAQNPTFDDGDVHLVILSASKSW